MCYYEGNSGIPWEDSNSTGGNPTVADAVVLSYVSNDSQFSVNTVSNYNNYDSTHNKRCVSRGGCPTIGNQNIGINVGGDTYLPLNFPIFMYEYGWAPSLSPGPGYSSGYYVGILQYNDTVGLRYFLTTQPNPQVECQTYDNSLFCSDGYYDYYYSGSADGGSDYYFLNDSNGNTYGYSGSNYFAFMPLDQQLNQPLNQPYSQYGLFWLYNWFQEYQEDNNMYIYFLMNGNIFNYPLASEQYNWECGCVFFICFTCSAYAIPPAPPANISTITGEPIFAQSYINAYNTAFNQPANPQEALYSYQSFTSSDVNNNNFVPGTFGYGEKYNDQSNPSNTIIINYLQDDANYYDENPYLFISAGSYGGSGYMYLDWIIVTYGVPYVVSVS